MTQNTVFLLVCYLILQLLPYVFDLRRLHIDRHDLRPAIGGRVREGVNFRMSKMPRDEYHPFWDFVGNPCLEIDFPSF
jgi:hypothetical protein